MHCDIYYAFVWLACAVIALLACAVQLLLRICLIGMRCYCASGMRGAVVIMHLSDWHALLSRLWHVRFSCYYAFV